MTARWVCVRVRMRRGDILEGVSRLGEIGASGDEAGVLQV